MNPDSVCEKYASSAPKLNIYVKDKVIVLEGDKHALKFLGELILAQADFKDDCGFSIGPKMAGSLFFHKKAKNGLYIHRKDTCKS